MASVADMGQSFGKLSKQLSFKVKEEIDTARKVEDLDKKDKSKNKKLKV